MYSPPPPGNVQSEVFYVFDERGNAVLRLDKNASVLSEHKYQAYGKETTTRTVASGAASDPWGFGAQYGYYTDHETGFVYCTFRYYDPNTGRWLSQDPIGLGGGQQNLYAYCGGDPIDEADPLGLQTLKKGGRSYGYPGSNPNYLSFQPTLSMGFPGYNGGTACSSGGSGFRASGGTKSKGNNGKKHLGEAIGITLGAAAGFAAKKKVEEIALDTAAIIAIAKTAKGVGVNLACTDFAGDLEAKLRIKGVKTRIIRAHTRLGWIYDDEQGFNISTNGKHFGVIADGMVYDNFNPEGLTEKAWRERYMAGYGGLRYDYWDSMTDKDINDLP